MTRMILRLYVIAILFGVSSVSAQGLLIDVYSDPASEGGNTFAGFNSGNHFMSASGGDVFFASHNTAVGIHSFSLNQTGYRNTAIGSNSLYANISGFHNTAVGFVSLASNDLGYNNTAIGHSAMYRNRNGVHNTSVGLQSLYQNISGSHNVAVGRDANFSNTTGNWNTGVGVDAIPGGTIASGNTGVGGEAGYTEVKENQNVTGNNNTWIGYQSGPSSPDQNDGSIGIGFRAKTSKSFQAVLGGTQITETLLRGNVGIDAENPAVKLVVNGAAINTTGAWGVYSDARLKTKVERYSDGLDAILRLKPVSFQYNGLAGLDTQSVQVGLIAQEVEEVAPYMISRQASPELDEVRVMSTQALPYMLINAIHDLQAKLVDMEAQIKASKECATTN